MKKVRIIHNLDYYKAEFIMADPKFNEFIGQLMKKFSDFGCPVPEKGFKNYKEYLEWNDKYFDAISKIEYGPEFKNKINKITGGNSSWGIEEQEKIEELRDKELPPIYGSDIGYMLEEYGISRKDKSYRKFADFIIEYIFFKKREFIDSQLVITWKRDEKTSEAELFIKILPHTRKEDIEKIWPMIKNAIQTVRGYITEYPESFDEIIFSVFDDRDLNIYNKLI